MFAETGNLKKNKMKKTILITGVTGAIGGATALEIAKSGATVVMLARNKDKVENLRKEISQKSGNNNIDILIADLSDKTSVKNAAKEFKRKYKRLDSLLNIAAVYKGKREITKDKLEMMFATNHLGPFILTNALLDLLKASKPSRVITVTAPSTTKINFDDLQGEKKFSPLNAFGASKMMNLQFTYALARQMKDEGVSATAFFPGLTKSNLALEMPSYIKIILKIAGGKPERSAKMLCRLALDQMYQNSNGKFYKFNGKEIKSSSYSYDNDIQDRLWKRSEQLSKTAKALIKKEELLEVY